MGYKARATTGMNGRRCTAFGTDLNNLKYTPNYGTATAAHTPAQRLGTHMYQRSLTWLIHDEKMSMIAAYVLHSTCAQMNTRVFYYFLDKDQKSRSILYKGKQYTECRGRISYFDVDE